MRWAGHVAHMGEKNMFRFLVRNAEGNRPFVKPRHRWEESVKIYLKDKILWTLCLP
jgi:hypothetical protein